MENWREEYKRKCVTAAEAVRKIPDGSHIANSHVAAEPRTVLKALADAYQEFTHLEVFSTHVLDDIPYSDETTRDTIHYSACFLGTASRIGVKEGWMDFIPSNYSNRCALMGNEIPVDVAIVMLSRPDEHGYCSFGVTVDHQKPLCQAAGMVIAEINDRMPRTLGSGASMIHVSEIDWIVESSAELPQMFVGELSDVDKAIGANCASLVKDGDTLQLGIGRIPDAVLLALENKHDLGVHSEMISDGVMKMMMKGNINNSKKTIDRDQVVATFLWGTNEFYDFVNNNPVLSMRAVNYTNNPAVIAQHEHFVSINSCTQIDLQGQICAEAVRGNQYSGVGGQVDFLRGCLMSPDGRGIIALPSTAAGGTVSRISVKLDEGNPVTTTRNDVDYVITEYGIAKLRGKSLRQRARALIEIAHPDFRQELRDAIQIRSYR